LAGLDEHLTHRVVQDEADQKVREASEEIARLVA